MGMRVRFYILNQELKQISQFLFIKKIYANEGVRAATPLVQDRNTKRESVHEQTGKWPPPGRWLIFDTKRFIRGLRSFICRHRVVTFNFHL